MKTIFSKISASILVLGVFLQSFPSILPVRALTQTFSDLTATDWFFQPVENGVTKKYIAAAENYRPKENMRRSETAKMLTLFAGYPLNLSEIELKNINFKDVPESEWYTDYVKTLVSHQVINGYLDEKGTPTGYFGPADFVTRNQIAALLNRILKLDSALPANSPFKDLNASHWAYKDVMALYKSGIIRGYEDKTYRGDSFINRAEMAQILDRAVQFLPKKDITPEPAPTPNPVKPDSKALNNEPISLAGPDGLTLTGRLYKPEGTGPFPGLVFMHGCSGLLTGVTSTNYLASQYVWWGEKMAKDEKVVALFVDSFTPRNIKDGVCNDGGTTLNEATERPKDAYAGLSYLRGLDYVQDKKIALMGWSNGGSAVLSAMAKVNNPVPLPAEGGFLTAIAEYPGCGLRSHYGTDYSTVSEKGTYLPYAPVIILAAGNDTTTPPEPKCTNLVNRAKTLGASETNNNSIVMNIYAGAGHSFDGAKEGTSSEQDLMAQTDSRKVVLSHFESLLGLN